jgi:hypothetical protein
MLHKRDPKTLYNIVDKKGTVLEVVYKSNALQRKAQLERYFGKKLQIVLRGANDTAKV